MTPLTCGMGRTSPSARLSLVTVNEGTSGRKSYGLGGFGRSAMDPLLGPGRVRASAARDGVRGDPRPTVATRASAAAPRLSADTSPSPRRRVRMPARRYRRGVPAPRSLGLPDSIRACLFDLDGVLTRTATVHFAAWKRTFDEFLRGHDPQATEFTQADYNTYVDGRQRADGVRGFLASRGITLPEGGPDDP